MHAVLQPGRLRAGAQHHSSHAGGRSQPSTSSCSRQVPAAGQRAVQRRQHHRAVSSKHQNADVVPSGAVQRQPGSNSSAKQEYEDDRELHRLLKESQRQLQVPYQPSGEDDEDDVVDPPGDVIAAAAAVAAAAAMQQQQPLPPPWTPPLIYGRGVALPNLGGGGAAQGGLLHPFGPLPQGAAAAPAAGSSGSSGGGGSAAAVGSAGPAQAQQQFYPAAPSLSSVDGAGSVAGQWPAGEPSSSPGAGRSGCPVYVMLPLDTVWVVERETQKVAILKREKALEIALHTLRQAGVEGVMVDVWWGIVERAGPNVYDFSAYRRLFNKCAVAGLKVQAVMSFHAAGGNVGDTCKIPLPKWVVDIGERNPDIFYTDKQMHRNKECLSLGCDEVPLFWGRSPVDMYRDFMDAFANTFQHMFGSVISEITVGLGPAGELRYPSYPEGDARWRFPGVGEYQCFDKYMLADLRAAAAAAGHPEWGHGGPHDAGQYNSRSWETGFFKSQGGRWQSDYGHFFQSWYSGLLVRHARRVLGVAAEVLNKPGRPRVMRACKEMQGGHLMYEFVPAVQLGAKLAGVHWWFKSSAHAAELTAGYYNTRFRDGYAPIIQVLAEFKGRLSFTCVEMRDCEHPPEGRCSPQGLLQQVLETAEHYGVPLAGENALQRYDEHAFDRIAESAFGRTARAGRLEQLTFLRMGDLMFDNWDAFCAFLKRMKGDHSSSSGGGGGSSSSSADLWQYQPYTAALQQQQQYGATSPSQPPPAPTPPSQQQQQVGYVVPASQQHSYSPPGGSSSGSSGGSVQQGFGQQYQQPYTQQPSQQQQQQMQALIYQQQLLWQRQQQQQQQQQQPLQQQQQQWGFPWQDNQQQQQQQQQSVPEVSGNGSDGSSSSSNAPQQRRQQQQEPRDPGESLQGSERAV